MLQAWLQGTAYVICVHTGEGPLRIVGDAVVGLICALEMGKHEGGALMHGRDGRQDRDNRYVAGHQKDCAKHGVGPHPLRRCAAAAAGRHQADCTNQHIMVLTPAPSLALWVPTLGMHNPQV